MHYGRTSDLLNVNLGPGGLQRIVATVLTAWPTAPPGPEALWT